MKKYKYLVKKDITTTCIISFLLKRLFILTRNNLEEITKILHYRNITDSIRLKTNIEVKANNGFITLGVIITNSLS